LLDLTVDEAHLGELHAGQDAGALGGELEELVDVAAGDEGVQVVPPGEGSGEAHLGHRCQRGPNGHEPGRGYPQPEVRPCPEPERRGGDLHVDVDHLVGQQGVEPP
jgi:hypothetical protein